jgi:deazaflavin-dependent oxidoreductase (nitroreductase family)
VGGTGLSKGQAADASPVEGENVPDFNAKIIEEFRATRGKVGGEFEGAPLLLLHHSGAKSGKERVHPVMYQPVGDDLAVFASNAGAPVHPAWYHNVMAKPQAMIEIGTEIREVRARLATDDERQIIWSRQKELYPGFADYETQTSRQIPVVILQRATSSDEPHEQAGGGT